MNEASLFAPLKDNRAKVIEEMLIDERMLMGILQSRLMLMYDMKVRTSPGVTHIHTHKCAQVHYPHRQQDLMRPSG